MDFKPVQPNLKEAIDEEFCKLGEAEIDRILEGGRRYRLGETLRAGGSILFPHADIRICGHQAAAAVQACLDSRAERVLVLGVLHALTPELEAARVRVAQGGEVSGEPLWGLQGPGLEGKEQWKNEFSLLNMLFLWEQELARRGEAGPELILRYPFLAGGKPGQLPGIGELEELVKAGAVVVTTTDPFHHGIGYGEPRESALAPEEGGLELARKRIEEGLVIQETGDYWEYNRHCVSARSDGRDVGQVLRYLLGPRHASLLELTTVDTTELYHAPPPTWVAAALVEYRP